MSSSNSYPPLALTLRFASDLPDLRLPTISNPATTTGLSLLPQIRNNLPKQQSSLRILLISGGRIIPLKEPLSTSIRLPTIKKLGKAKARVYHADNGQLEQETGGEDGEDIVHYIIHATFSSLDAALSAEELAAETLEGKQLNGSLQASLSDAQLSPGGIVSASTATAVPSHNTRELPQGFSRLLATGIPEQEINALRTQFRSLLAAARPGAAPLTPIELLSLEERWLDDAAGPGTQGDSNIDIDLLSALNTGGGADGDGTTSASQIDDVLWGNILGFFWPLGALFWLSRQDGVWRGGRGLSVFVGVLVNLAFCLIRSALAGGSAA